MPPSLLRYPKYALTPWSKHSSTQVPRGSSEFVAMAENLISSAVTPGTAAPDPPVPGGAVAAAGLSLLALPHAAATSATSTAMAIRPRVKGVRCFVMDRSLPTRHRAAAVDVRCTERWLVPPTPLEVSAVS